MKFVDEQGEEASLRDGATGLPRTPRGGAPRPAARCVDRLRPTGAAAAHPSQRAPAIRIDNVNRNRPHGGYLPSA
jgi:hypothetical protein